MINFDPCAWDFNGLDILGLTYKLLYQTYPKYIVIINKNLRRPYKFYQNIVHA